MRRVEYPAEGFSVAIPSAWQEVDSAGLARINAVVPKIVPNAPELKINHGFVPPGEAGFRFPWVALLRTDQRVSDAIFEDLGGAFRTLDEMTKKWTDPASGSLLESTQVKPMFYDKGRHVLWLGAESTFSGIGDLRTLSAAYLTRDGSVQVHCYMRAADYGRDLPLCRQVTESMTIDPKMAYGAPMLPVPPMTLDQADKTYRELVDRVNGGDLRVDFRLLRFACVASRVCDLHGKHEDLLAMSQAGKDNQPEKVAKIAEGLIEQGFANMEAHAVCAKVYADLKQPEKAKFHLDVTAALMRSILNSGDGKSKETAFEIVHTREQLYVLAALGLPSTGEGVLSVETVKIDPHRWEKWEALNPKTGGREVVFFNTDVFLSQAR
jgi:hypothetical protein